jgi:hypothetical protein
MLKVGLLSILVLVAVVFVVSGRPVLGIMFAVSAVLADGRPARYLSRVRAGRARRPGAE